MKTNGGFLVTKIKQLGDRIFEKILSEKNIDAFNGAQGRILYVLAGGWNLDQVTLGQMRISDNISYDDAGKNGTSRADKPCSV